MDCSNKYALTMATSNYDARCPEDMKIQVYNNSFLSLLRKSPNKTPAQFIGSRLCSQSSQPHLFSDKTNIQNFNLVVRHAYKECVSMKSIGIGILEKEECSVVKSFAIPT
jgi:hypothetical protein